jgi:hypothetical protein
MFAGFKYESVPLKDIALDDRNPRIVSQTPLSSQGEILSYLYENEDLESFVKKIASEGKNLGAERPYVVKKGSGYIVIEGNTRIAAYKLLTGLVKPPSDHAGTVPHISDATRKNLQNIDCSIAPDRDALMPIMASAHFGTGDKSKWGYLGSRKAVYDEWKSGKTLPKLAKLFHVTQGEIKELILEYQLYRKALSLTWTHTEKDILLKPNLAFNPPVRFLQSSGHKDKMGISYDNANLKVVMAKDADKKFKHLLNKLVINPVSCPNRASIHLLHADLCGFSKFLFHRRFTATSSAAAPSHPVLDPHSRHAAELTQIVGDDDQSSAAGMAADLHVVWAAGRARTLELRAKLTVMRRRPGVERQHVQPRNEMLDGRQIIGAARRLLRAIVQFAERDAGDADLLGQ